MTKDRRAPSLLKTLSILPSVATGMIAVVVGFASSVAIVFQAATAAHASSEQISSWIFAAGIGAGLTTIGLSLYFKTPVLTAWSTPGAALLASSLGRASYSEVLGAFLISGCLITLAGVTGWFEKVMNRIPVAIAASMLAGVLLRFGLDVFVSLKQMPLLIFSMLTVYFISKRIFPRYAVIWVLLTGVLICALAGNLHFESFSLALAKPVFEIPTFSWNVLLGISLPLFIVTMASQNLPGVAMLWAHGYRPSISKMVSITGLATLLLAPIGAFSINLAAITAGICMGPESHLDPSRRYYASVAAGFFYLIVGLLGATVASLLVAFPKELIFSLAGIALFGTIASSLTTALKEDSSREAALICFLVTASGITLFQVGAPFWGLIAGVVVLAITSRPSASRGT